MNGSLYQMSKCRPGLSRNFRQADGDTIGAIRQTRQNQATCGSGDVLTGLVPQAITAPSAGILLVPVADRSNTVVSSHCASPFALPRQHRVFPHTFRTMASAGPDSQSLKSWQDAFQYPIPTVRRVEQELRRDIASNKEKLRALVGYG